MQIHQARIEIAEIDPATAPGLKDFLLDQPPGGLVLDFTNVEFLDSTGLRVLVNEARRREPGRVQVVNPSRRVARVFEITNLAEHFGIAAA